MNDLAKEIVARAEKLESLKMPWNQLFQDCADFVLPRRSTRFTSQTSTGQRLSDKIFDGTAPWANEQLAAGLHSFLTSPTSRWFKFQCKEQDLNEDEEIRAWLDDCANRVYAMLNNDATQFNPQVHELYLDLGALGTGVMFLDELFQKEQPPFRFMTMHLGECSIAENEYGRVDTLYRRFKLGARNAAQMFGTKLPPKMLEDAVKDPFKEHSFIHAVYPNDSFKKDQPEVASNRRFKSCYVLKDEPVLLREGGFSRFPFLVPRWSKVSGETYGRSPAMTCLPDITMVNEMSKTIIIAAQKIVDPALQMPDEGFMLPIKTHPGGINYYDASLNENHRIMPIETKGRVDIGIEMINARREHIVRSFYVDWMQLQEGPQMTATEVVQRNEDKMRLMAPMTGRLQSEFLNELLEYVFEIMLRRGFFLKPPQQLQGKEIKIEYVSPVARAQRMSQLFGFQRMMENIAVIAQVKPEVLDRINEDQVPVVYADLMDVPAKLIRSDKDVQAIRHQRSQAQNMAQQSGMAEQFSKTVKNLSAASPEAAAQMIGGAPAKRK